MVVVTSWVGQVLYQASNNENEWWDADVLIGSGQDGWG